MGRKKKYEEAPSGGTWLTTFADLTTLLLTFFVLLISMATIDDTRQRQVLDSLVGSFGFLSGGRSAMGAEKGSDPREFTSPLNKSKPFDVEMLQEITLQNAVDSDVQVLKENNKIIIRINEKVIFLPESTELKVEIKDYLKRLATHLKTTTKEVEIKGHTDIHEILKNGGAADRTAEYSWYLSSKRAQVVYDFLGQQGIPREQMSASGFSYYCPIVDDEHQLEERGHNQRVDIIIGPAESIPEVLLAVRSNPRKGINYKNFFFQLFPDEKKDSKGSL